MTDCATNYTRDFVRSALPPGARRVLEIGCGDGALAAALMAEGLEVVAIDADETAVARARALGADARIATWPDFSDGRFDAVLFTRSLHHVGDLGENVAAAFATIGAAGRVIVEDFAAEGGSARSCGWFQSFAAMLNRSDMLPNPTPYLSQVIAGGEDEDHDHHLHSSTAIGAALRAQATELRTENAAYYFRYLLPAISDRPGFAEAILEHERMLIQKDVIDPLGRRYVASRHPS